MSWSRPPVGDKDIVVRGGGLEADAAALAAAVAQLNTWGEGRLLLDGHVIQTEVMWFSGNISLCGVNPSATLEVRVPSATSPIAWNVAYNPKLETTYSFTQASDFADYFTPVGTTLNDGDLVCMWSNDSITGAAPHNGLVGTQCPMEIHQIHEWDGVNGRAYTADPIIDRMQTSPLFCKMTPSTHIMVCDLNIMWGGATPPYPYLRALDFECCSGVRIYNVHFPRNGPGSLYFRYCTDVEVDRHTMWGQSNTNAGWDGIYGIVAAIVNGVRVTGSHLVGSRHAFTTEGIDSGNTRWGTSLNCVVEGNTVMGSQVKVADAGPSWDERILLDTHSEGYGVVFSDNDIYLSGSINNVGIQCRSRAAIVRNNRIHGGYYSATGAPRTQEGIRVNGKDTVVEGNWIDRCSTGIITKAETSDYEVYARDVLIGRNTITNCRLAGIVVNGDRTHVYENRITNTAYETGSSPLRVGSLIQLGVPLSYTVSSFSGTTVTTTTAHGLSISHQVRFRPATGASLPSPLEEGTYYWVIARTAYTLTISTTKGGSSITFSGGSGTVYMDSAYLPPKDCVIENNMLNKGTNSTAICCMGLATDEVTITNNQALGYGSGTTIFENRFGEAAEMQAAWHSHNRVDRGDMPINVRDFGAKGDGSTDDTDAIQAAIDAMPAVGGVLVFPPGTYIVDETAGIASVYFYQMSDFVVYGNKAVIKAADDMPVLTNNALVVFRQCDRFSVYDLYVDGNRSNRTEDEVWAHSIVIEYSSYGSFENCHADNAVCDGWYISSTNTKSPATFTHNCVFRNCTGINCYRQGMSIINGYDCQVIGGTYSEQTGTSPTAGIDIEPNAASATFTADAGTDVCTSSSHGFSENQRVYITTTGTIPGGLDEVTPYYLVDVDTSEFSLSLTEGGDPIDITSAGSPTHTLHLYEPGCKNILISGVTLTDNDGSGVQVNGYYGRIENTTIQNCTFKNNQQSGDTARCAGDIYSYPMGYGLPWGGETVNVLHNRFTGDKSQVYIGCGSALVEGNLFEDCDLHEGMKTSASTYSGLVHITSACATYPAVQITKNKFINIGPGDTTPYVYAIYCHDYVENLLIEGNVFDDVARIIPSSKTALTSKKFLGNTITRPKVALAGCAFAANDVICGNTFSRGSTAAGGEIDVYNYLYLNAENSDNAILVTNNVFKNHAPSADADYGMIRVVGGRAIIDNNIFWMTTPTDCSAVTLGSTSAASIVLGNNHSRGFQNNTNPTYNIPYTHAVPPAAGTWHVGDKLNIAAPVAGQFIGLVCTAEGTMGTLAGVTASTTASSADIVVTDDTNLFVGQFITIAGVTGIKRIIAKVDATNTLTLDSVCDATVPTGAVAYSAATFKTFGAVTS